MGIAYQNRNYQQLARELDALLTDPEIPVLGYALSVVEHGTLLYQRQAGFRRYIEGCRGQTLPITRDTRFRIASISKLFTAVAIMQQVELGRLDLDHDASDYLGFSLRNPHYPGTAITPRMLLSHVSSIRDGGAYSIPCAVPISACFLPGGRYYDVGAHFAHPEQNRDMSPGHFYMYSNLNYGILGTILERLSGERFDRYMRGHVLRPMGIRGSFNPGDFDAQALHNLSAIYKRMENGIWAVDQPWTAQMDDFRDVPQSPDRIIIGNPDLGVANYEEDVSGYQIGTNGTLFSPQGGLRVSAYELSLLSLMLLGGGTAQNGTRILSPASVRELLTPVWVFDPALDNRDPTDSAYCYGAGFNLISPKYGGDHMVEGVEHPCMAGHTGSAYGLISACYVAPELDFGFAYVFNGLGAPQENHPGVYSGRCIWHEKAMTAIYSNLLR